MSVQDQHMCVLCNTKFKFKDELQEHFRKHGKELDMRGRPLNRYDISCITQCDICLISFDRTSTAINHRFKVHPNAPPIKFYCHYCGKVFPLKAHRDHHQLSHDESESKRKKYHRKCEKCNVLFYNEDALKYHYRYAHQTMSHLLQPLTTPPSNDKVKTNSINDMGVHYCHLCGIEHHSKNTLQQHLEKTHLQDDNVPIKRMKGIKCIICSGVFCSQKAYDVHYKYHNPNDLYIIDEEQKSNVTTVDLDFDIKSTTYKHMSQLKAPKRQSRHRWKNKMQNMETKEEKQVIKQKIEQEEQQEYVLLSSDDETANDSTSLVTSREIWHLDKEFPSANDSSFDNNCEKVPSVFEEKTVT